MRTPSPVIGFVLAAWCVAGLPGCGDDSSATGNNDNANQNVNHNQNVNQGPVCGNGEIESGEVCDDGNASDDDACLTGCADGTDCCVPSACGDGFRNALPDGQGGTVEACDDGVNDGTTCRADCGQDFTLCGNGAMDQGEACDDGGQNSDETPDACRTRCELPSCGDGVVDSGETCDASVANGVSPQPCLTDCTITTCGDGYLGVPEACDDGAANSDLLPDACRTDCQPARCGDGVKDALELCDATDFGGSTCSSMGGGYDGGSLACTAACEIVTSGCTTCGNGSCEPGESAGDCPDDCAALDIAAGNRHTCAIVADRTVRCWGDNQHGQLGDGTGLNSSVPVKVALPDDPPFGLRNLTSGEDHTCVVWSTQADGKGDLYCWGSNDYGQVGDGTQVDAVTPTLVFGLAGMVATSRFHTCATRHAILMNGLYCWGGAGFGELGTGQDAASLTPLWSAAVSSIVAIAAGIEHTCMILSTNVVQCWGTNDNAQLGDGTTTRRNDQTAVQGAPTYELSSATIAAGNRTTCISSPALGGTTWCWGRNDYGQLGDGGTVTQSGTPLLAFGGEESHGVAVGGLHMCLLHGVNQEVVCYGRNSFGELGDGTTDHSASAVWVLGITPPLGSSGVVKLSLGSSHSCALRNTGEILCWGSNFHGSLGIGSAAAMSSTPVNVVGF
jgi:alpha-tubulin suppressor-like RCC1 family protein